MVLVMSSCQQKEKHENKKIFRYNEASGIMTLDPVYARDQAHIWVCNQLYNGLVQLDEQLNVIPSVALTWEISKDGLTYVFHLRNDVFFHQDEVFQGKDRKVTAADFVYSFRRLASPETASPGAWVLSPVARKESELAIEAVNDSTLVIHLEKPFPPFLSILSMQYCSVLPREAVEFYKNDFRKHPVGTGPFYLRNWEENIKMVLRRNSSYFERAGDVKLPLLDAVSITFVEDKMTAFLEFTKGNLDFLSGIYPSYKDELLNRKGELREKYTDKFRMISVPYLNTEYLGILVDTSVKNNPLKDLRLRQAINYGFDREKMIRFLRNGIGIPGNRGMIPKGMPAYGEQATYGYHYNPDKSRALIGQLKDEGYTLQGIQLVTTSDYLDLCKFVQAQLDEIGLQIEIEVVPPAVAIELRAHSRVNFFRASWIADYPDEENYLSLFYSKNFAPDGPNYTHYANSRFDKLFEQAYLENDRKKRSELYRVMDSIVMSDAPVVVLYYDEAVRFLNKEVKGMRVNPINLLDLKEVDKIN
ncbi:MAG TPA: ABC transporter substrate-binding protein [Bacteroidetes bacterium]|nr:ABC transporter substrate-binding protein [Bacteroidota bacterium]